MTAPRNSVPEPVEISPRASRRSCRLFASGNLASSASWTMVSQADDAGSAGSTFAAERSTGSVSVLMVKAGSASRTMVDSSTTRKIADTAMAPAPNHLNRRSAA